MFGLQKAVIPASLADSVLPALIKWAGMLGSAPGEGAKGSFQPTASKQLRSTVQHRARTYILPTATLASLEDLSPVECGAEIKAPSDTLTVACGRHCGEDSVKLCPHN